MDMDTRAEPASMYNYILTLFTDTVNRIAHKNDLLESKTLTIQIMI